MESDHRPWGAWYRLDRGDGYQVKRIVVNPGQRLSYQTHARRAEQWVVVRGTATCTVDGSGSVSPTGSPTCTTTSSW